MVPFDYDICDAVTKEGLLKHAIHSLRTEFP